VGRLNRAALLFSFPIKPMKVRYLVSMAGPLYAVIPGDIRDIDEAEALRLFARGYAEPVQDEPEAAAMPPRRNALLDRHSTGN
jgi:hypothetical protein